MVILCLPSKGLKGPWTGAGTGFAVFDLVLAPTVCFAYTALSGPGMSIWSSYRGDNMVDHRGDNMVYRGDNMVSHQSNLFLRDGKTEPYDE